MVPVSPKLVRDTGDVEAFPAKILEDDRGPALIVKSGATDKLNVVV
jgi:hypothetical protein